MARHKAHERWRVDWTIGGHICPGKTFPTKSEARGYAAGKLKQFPASAEGYEIVKVH